MSFRSLRQPRSLLSALLIAGAALFAVGVAAERHATDQHTESGTEAVTPTASAAIAATSASVSDTDGGEGATHTEVPGGEGATHTQSSRGEATGQSETSGETVVGLNLESNALVSVAVAVSLALAALTWLRNRRSLLVAAVGFALVFAVFDIAEVAHQINESRAGLATLAAAIGVVHLATALVAQQRATTASS